MVLIDPQPDSHQCGQGDAAVPRIGFAAAAGRGKREEGGTDEWRAGAEISGTPAAVAEGRNVSGVSGDQQRA